MRIIKGSPDEIVLPETKPESEWIAGRAVQKVSPTRGHSRLQSRLLLLLSPWAEGRGEVGVEWRVRLAPPGEMRRPLVPDVSYVANERLRGLSSEELELPGFAPDAVFEVRSPDDRQRDIDEKIRVYLASGARVVVIVDPRRRTLRVVDSVEDRILIGESDFEHPALPGFRMSLAVLFSALEPPIVP